MYRGEFRRETGTTFIRRRIGHLSSRRNFAQNQPDSHQLNQIAIKSTRFKRRPGGRTFKVRREIAHGGVTWERRQSWRQAEMLHHGVLSASLTEIISSGLSMESSRWKFRRPCQAQWKNLSCDTVHRNSASLGRERRTRTRQRQCARALRSLQNLTTISLPKMWVPMQLVMQSTLCAVSVPTAVHRFLKQTWRWRSHRVNGVPRNRSGPPTPETQCAVPLTQTTCHWKHNSRSTSLQPKF